MSSSVAPSANFDIRYAALNPEQRRAVDTLDGPVMVIAGPGTGKTEVLTMRIANILRRGGAPKKILALTFTESGAISMRRRLVELIGADAYRVEISTFHGFANRIIRDYPDYFPSIIGASSITEIEQVSILRRLLDTLPLKDLRPFGDRYYHLRGILSAINELKQQGVSPETFFVIAADAKKDFHENPDLINQSGAFEGKMKGKYVTASKHVERNGELAIVYAEYQKTLLAGRQYDYSDMIMYVALALEHDDELTQVLQNEYEYFLIDEHQDTNDAQNKIIELIAGGERPNLFVVGDEKQAIYRFQGASLENFHYFRNHYKDVVLITLRNNYRSTQAILDAAQNVSPREVALVANAGHATAARAAHGEEPAHLAVLSSPAVEYYFIARKIKELIYELGVPAEEIAVLYHNNKDVVPLAAMLEKQKVLFNIESNQDVLGDEEIKKLVRLLRAVQHFGSDVWLAEALHVDFLGIAPIDVYKVSAYAARQHTRMYEVMRSPATLDAAGVDNASKMAYERLFHHLSEWKRGAKNRGAGEAFEMIVYQSGFIEAILNHPSATEKLAKLHALFDLLKSFIERQKNYTLEDFFVYLDLMEEHELAIRGRDTARLPGRVRLMTAHGSKGLEFDYVFIMNAVDRKWGSRTHRESIKLPTKIYRAATGQSGAGDDDDCAASAADDLADERNVFYVALTRARKGLFITLAKTDQSAKEQLPTQFIAALGEDMLAPYDVAAHESDFAARRAEIEFAPADAASANGSGASKLPELKDKEFLNGLFRAQGISVTALNNYLECPWAYFYRNLIRIPEAPNKNLSFGNAVHAALKSYFDALGDGNARGREYLVQRFEESIAHEPIKESEYKEALEKGRRALPLFYDAYHLVWSPRALNEVRVDGIVLEDGTPINGKLDRIEFLEGAAGADLGGREQAKENVRVVDYKTGKPKTRNDIEGNTASSDGDYKRQLVFYKLLLDKEGKRNMTDGVIQFIEPDDRGKMHREEFVITPGEVTVLEAQVMQVAREILDLSFWDKGCHDPDCKYCELRKGMK